MSKDKRSRPLPSLGGGGGESIGTFLAGLEQHILHRRPPVAIVVEEHDRTERSRLNGVSLELPDDPIERPEPPDRSGARL